MIARRSDHSARVCFWMVAVMLIATACGRSGGGISQPPDNNALATLAAQTLQAQSVQLTLAAGSALLTAQAGGGGQPLPGQAGSLTISATVDTNCRSGPGTSYPAVGYLGAGQQSTVYGKEASGNWWYIQNPKNPAEYCWVWAETTTVTGDTSALPNVEAPPPPVAETQPPQKAEPPVPPPASFTAGFQNTLYCNMQGYVTIRVTNNGGVAFYSATLTVTDLTRARRVSGPTTGNAVFHTTVGDCSPGDTVLPTGATRFLIAACGVENCLDLGKAAVTVTLCSQANGQGSCKTDKIETDFAE